MTSKIVNKTIIEGPDGILKMYEKYSPNRIPRKEKNTDKNSIDEYLLAIIEAVAWGIVRIEIISMIPIVFIFMIMAEETSIIIK